MNIETDHPNSIPTSRGLELLAGNTLNLRGQKVPLLSGEVQFFRMDPRAWEPSLRGVKALGLPIVSTYLGWRRFSLGPDRYDLTGVTDPRLNVPAFLDLCRKLGLWVTLKPGPWICAEETNGGYPEWLVADPELQALDSQDRPIAGYMPPFQSPIPSYLHPRYQEHVRVWLEAVDRVTRPYCYPNGPIVLVQLDNEPCFTFHDRVFESDYHPMIAAEGGLYGRWLAERQETPEEPASTLPPRTLELARLADLPRYWNWVEFKEWLLAEHVRSIGEQHLRNGLERVLFTINYNHHPQLAVPNDWRQLEKASGIGGFDYYPHLPMAFEDLAQIAMAVNYSRCVNRVAWSPEIMCGVWSFDGQEHTAGDFQPADFEYLYLACLAFGLKGMNFYMLADRDNWVGSPLDEAGKLTPSAQAVEKTVRIMTTVPHFFELQREQPIGVIAYRPYAREAFVADGGAVDVDGYRLGEAYTRYEQVYRELFGQNFDPGLIDLEAVPESLDRFRIAVLPSGLYLDRAAQANLARYIHAGGCLVVFPALPKLGLDFAPCSLLESGEGGTTARSVGPWQFHRLGRGYWIENRSTQPAAADWDTLFRELHALPAVGAAGDRILTCLHTGKGEPVLFALNPDDRPATASLRFRDRMLGHLVEVDRPANAISIQAGRAELELPARSVRVFAIQD